MEMEVETERERKKTHDEIKTGGQQGKSAREARETSQLQVSSFQLFCFVYLFFGPGRQTNWVTFPEGTRDPPIKLQANRDSKHNLDVTSVPL